MKSTPLTRAAFFACRGSATALALLALPLSVKGEGPSREASHEETQGGRFVLERESASLREGYALLFALASNEASVDKVFFIKNGSPALRETIKAVAEEAASLRHDLEAFRSAGTHGGNLGLFPYGDGDLPPVEIATRHQIATQKRQRILGGARPLFEKELLISQCEGLSYGTCLLQTLSEQEHNPVRSRLLRKHALAWADLRQRVVSELTATP